MINEVQQEITLHSWKWYFKFPGAIWNKIKTKIEKIYILKHKAFLCVLSYTSYGRRSSMKINQAF